MEADPGSVALRPFDVQQLQDEFHSFSPREAYIHLCDRIDCKPILPVASLFPRVVGLWDGITSIDLSMTYVGPKGVRPVVELCKRLPRLTSLNLSENYLTNDSVLFLSQMAVFHPQLESLELSRNEQISWSGAMCLAELITRNLRITYLGLRHTAIQPQVVEDLFLQCRRNAVTTYAAQERAPKPSSHPAAIHLRAMKRFFAEIQEDGTVGLDGLVEGFHERLRTLGRQREISSYTDAFFEKLKSRAPSERIHWEAFLVLLLIDGSEYDQSLVDRLQSCFLEFSMEANSGLEAGFVEVRSFHAMCARLFGEPPTTRVLSHTLDLLGLDDGMTVSWDEFLLVMYHRGPNNVGTKSAGMYATPMQKAQQLPTYTN